MPITTDIFVAGGAAWLPPAISAKQAVVDGQYSEADLAANGIACVPASESLSAPEMAAAAAKLALARADGVSADSVALVLHASLYFQGREFWSPASYVQREAGISGAVAINVGQMSNGGLAALELAVPYLAARPGAAALVTTGDRFAAPGFDRWSADYGIVYGDGATSLVLSTSGGFARLRSLRSLTDASLEQLHRGSTDFTDRDGGPVDVRRAKREYLMSVGMPSIMSRSAAGAMAVVGGALADAGIGFADIAKVVLPNLGHQLLAGQYLQPMGMRPDQTLMSWGAHTGHLGAGDQLAGLTHLIETGQVEPGQQVLLFGAGGGFSWSAAVVEVLHAPTWTDVTTEPSPPADVAG